jgi:pilus assembly protein CpaB
MLAVASIALVLSVVVTFLTYRMLRDRLQRPEEMTTVVTAAQKVALGSRLTEADLRVSPWPKTARMEGSFQDPKQLVGRGVIVAMVPNEPILEAKLAPTGAGAGLTTAIPEGMRALAIKVNDVIGVAGFVIPGTRVDIILSGQLANQQVSKIILENVQVLAAGQSVEQDPNGKPMNVSVITLLVTPDDAQKLALASGEGRLQLALRNPLDMDKNNPKLVGQVALYSGSLASGSLMLPAPPSLSSTPAAWHYPRSKPANAGPRTASRRPAPRPVAVATAKPPAPLRKPEPRILEVQLILGNTSQILKFVEKPVRGSLN